MLKRLRHGRQQATVGFTVNNFQTDDYILPLSSGTTCRLKKHAKPSILDTITQPVTIPDALQQSRLENRKRRPLPEQTENLSPPEKIAKTTEDQREELEKTLRQKIHNLQQKLRHSKQKVKSISEVIRVLREKHVINSSVAEALHSEFDNIQLQFLYNFKNNLNASPSARRYSDELKEFSITLHYYSPKAYEYIRSIVPLPNRSLIKKWSSKCACKSGFIEEAFALLSATNDKDPFKYLPT